eukprot:gene4467-685_t
MYDAFPFVQTHCKQNFDGMVRLSDVAWWAGTAGMRWNATHWGRLAQFAKRNDEIFNSHRDGSTVW